MASRRTAVQNIIFALSTRGHGAFTMMPWLEEKIRMTNKTLWGMLITSTRLSITTCCRTSLSLCTGGCQTLSCWKGAIWRLHKTQMRVFMERFGDWCQRTFFTILTGQHSSLLMSLVTLILVQSLDQNLSRSCEFQSLCFQRILAFSAFKEKLTCQLKGLRKKKKPDAPSLTQPEPVGPKKSQAMVPDVIDVNDFQLTF